MMSGRRYRIGVAMQYQELIVLQRSIVQFPNRTLCDYDAREQFARGIEALEHDGPAIDRMHYVYPKTVMKVWITTSIGLFVPQSNHRQGDKYQLVMCSHVKKAQQVLQTQGIVLRNAA